MHGGPDGLMLSWRNDVSGGNGLSVAVGPLVLTAISKTLSGVARTSHVCRGRPPLVGVLLKGNLQLIARASHVGPLGIAALRAIRRPKGPLRWSEVVWSRRPISLVFTHTAILIRSDYFWPISV